MFYDLNNQTVLKYVLKEDIYSVNKKESAIGYKAVLALHKVTIHTLERLDDNIVRIKGRLRHFMRVNGQFKYVSQPFNMKVYSTHSVDSKEDITYFHQKLTPFEEDTVQVNDNLKIVTSKEELEKMDKEFKYIFSEFGSLESYEKYPDISEYVMKDVNSFHKEYLESYQMSDFDYSMRDYYTDFMVSAKKYTIEYPDELVLREYYTTPIVYLNDEKAFKDGKQQLVISPTSAYLVEKYTPLIKLYDLTTDSYEHIISTLESLNKDTILRPNRMSDVLDFVKSLDLEAIKELF